MTGDDVVAQEACQDAAWDLLLVAAFLISIFVSEQLGQISWPMDQDIPLGCEEEFHSTMLEKWFLDILFEYINLIYVFEQWYKSHPERDGRNPFWIFWRLKKDMKNRNYGLRAPDPRCCCLKPTSPDQPLKNRHDSLMRQEMHITSSNNPLETIPRALMLSMGYT